jgi:hypothetical protein
LTEEDCAEAIDVFNAERHGVLRGRDGRAINGAQYFRAHDDGMHVLAFILYRELCTADFSRWTTFEDFLLRLFTEGRLKSGELQQRFESLEGHYDVKALTEN